MMARIRKFSRGSVFAFLAILFVYLAAPASGNEHWSTNTVLDADNAVALLGEEFEKWADLYLPTSVSPTSPCGRALQAMFADLTNSTDLWAITIAEEGASIQSCFLFRLPFAWWNSAAKKSRVAVTMISCISSMKVGCSDGEAVSRCSTSSAQLSARYAIEEEKKRQSMNTPRPRQLHRPGVPWLDPLPLTADKDPRTVAYTILTTTYQYGTCMPDVCTETDLTISVNEKNLIGQDIFAVAMCSNEEPKVQFTNADVGFMALVTFLVVLIVCSSLVDMYLTYIDNKTLRKGAIKYLLVFSAYTNLSKMLQINPDPSPDTITCLNGMRVLSMTWVLYSHQQGTTFFNTANLLNIPKRADGFLAQTISNGFPSVDTFFFFSGLLVTFSVLRGLARGKFSIVLFFFHRFIRLIPPIAIVAGFAATVLRFFVSGPFSYMWDYSFQAYCVNNWWKDVLFVNNFMYDEDCLAQVWYVAVDTQLYLVAPIIILPLFFREAIGKAWLFLVTVASAVIPAAIIYVNDYPPTNFLYGPEGSIEMFLNVYLKPWCRAEPWMAGAWLGYIFYKQDNKKVKMSGLIVAVGWTLAAVTGLLVVYGMASYNKIVNHTPYEMMTQVVYGGGHRLAWGAALAWLVFACHNGYGGIVDDFLSHPIWQPISRLTYSIYLVAFPIQFLLAYNLRVAAYYSHVTKILETVGALVVALPCAVLVSLMAESPVMGLEKLLLSPGKLNSYLTFCTLLKNFCKTIH
ncbi:Nose resistant to fluoxetine protein 6 [Chionoecetes opilio]|uniref:Nose resistant to fluoxetine protein 6 n=1 Tax=Chionoecetes opilio TaxID=41210 RepID=A0A8J4XMY9_CHIOP|nr:Nose resistant to fluoxetine protein 6 [Chionoecetes opilio]